MNSILKDKLSELSELCKKYKVQTMFAFGSVCTDSFNESSDIDLLISFQKPAN
jgi:uncharacterized protein